MTATYGWGMGRAGNPVVANDVLAARRTLGRMDRGLGAPRAYCAPDVWDAVVASRELQDHWTGEGAAKTAALAQARAEPFEYAGVRFERHEENAPGTALLFFFGDRMVTVEDCA